MTQTTTRLFAKPEDALAAIHELEQIGVEAGHISLVANNTEAWADQCLAGGVEPARDLDAEGEARHGVDTGMLAGGVLGANLGALAGLGVLAIPGAGAAVAAGWLFSAAVGALAGAATGGATGGLLGALKQEGVTDQDAEVLVEGVRRGGAVVSVRSIASEASRVRDVLERHGGEGADLRGQVYREAGWTGFDPSAPAYGAEDMAAERTRVQAMRPRERRSFEAERGVRSEPDDITDPARERPLPHPSQRP